MPTIATTEKHLILEFGNSLRQYNIVPVKLS